MGAMRFCQMRRGAGGEKLMTVPREPVPFKGRFFNSSFSRLDHQLQLFDT
jgi:hypothetical protein